MEIPSTFWDQFECILRVYFLPVGIHLSILCVFTTLQLQQPHLDHGSFPPTISVIWLAQWMINSLQFEGKDHDSFSFRFAISLARFLKYRECPIHIHEVTEYLSRNSSNKESWEASWLYLYYYLEFIRHLVAPGVWIFRKEDSQTRYKILWRMSSWDREYSNLRQSLQYFNPFSWYLAP